MGRLDGLVVMFGLIARSFEKGDESPPWKICSNLRVVLLEIGFVDLRLPYERFSHARRVLTWASHHCALTTLPAAKTTVVFNASILAVKHRSGQDTVPSVAHFEFPFS